MIAKTYIPGNCHGIPAGYYSQRGIVALLRRFSGMPAAVYFIADMLE